MDGQARRKREGEPIKLTSDGPYDKSVEESKLNSSAGRDGRKFEVRCHAGDAGHLEVASDSVSVRVGQRIRREGKEELSGCCSPLINNEAVLRKQGTTRLESTLRPKCCSSDFSLRERRQ